MRCPKTKFHQNLKKFSGDRKTDIKEDGVALRGNGK